MEAIFKGICIVGGMIMLPIAMSLSVYDVQFPLFLSLIMIFLPSATLIIRHIIRFLGTPTLEKNLDEQVIDQTLALLRAAVVPSGTVYISEHESLSSVSSGNSLKGKALVQIRVSQEALSFTIRQGSWSATEEELKSLHPIYKSYRFANLASYSLSGHVSQGPGTSYVENIRVVPDNLALLIYLHFLTEIRVTSADMKELNFGETVTRLANQLASKKEEVLSSKSLDCITITIAKRTETSKPEIQKTQGRKPTLGREVNGWKLIKKLGSGGFGDVFLATKSFGQHSRQVALKIFSPKSEISASAYPKMVKDFLAEAKLSIAASGSPYVLAAGDFGEEPRPWIVYPFIEGETLQSRLGSTRGISKEQWWSIAYDLISGLKHLADQGVVHRDIKPANIMLTKSRAIYLDLGISSVMGYSNDLGISYSPGYVPPEVAIRNSPLKPLPSQDVFSLGLTLYVALTRKIPWKWPANPKAWPTVISSRPLDFAGFSFPEAELLDNMLQLDPADRATPDELFTLVSKQVDLQMKHNLEADYFREANQSDEDVYEGDFDSTFENIKEFGAEFTSWKQIESIYQNEIIKFRPRMFLIQFHLENIGRMNLQGMPLGDKLFIEVQFHDWKGMPFGPRFKKQMDDLGWTPPTKDAPFHHKYIDSSNWSKAMTENNIEILEQVCGLGLSSVGSLEIDVTGKNYQMK